VGWRWRQCKCVEAVMVFREPHNTGWTQWWWHWRCLRNPKLWTGSRRLWHRNYSIHNLTMDTKIYRLYGIDTAMHLLRPGAKWEISNSVITKWDDPRPQPSMEEVREVMDKIQKFEDSINTVWLPEQIEELTGRK
jgi:hypothetical protein